MERKHNAYKHNVVILLTACVNPGNVSFLKRRDPNLRYRDYLWALKLWLADSDCTPIIFCENSNQELSGFVEFVKQHNPHQKPFELLSFYGQNFPGHLGKGYGEMGIISHTLDKSTFIQNDTMVFKVTGRYYLKNISSIIKKVSKMEDIEVFCDLRHNLTMADSRVFCASVTFLKDFLIPLKEIIDDSRGILFETALARAVHLGMAQGLRWALLPSTPNLRGIYATSNQPYKKNFIHWLLRESHRFLKEAVLMR